MRQLLKYLLIVIVTFVVTTSFSTKADNSEASSAESLDYINNRLLQRVMSVIRDKYIQDISDQELYEKAIDGLLTSLDPHSAFLDQRDYNEMKIATSGEFGGIGIEITMEQGVLKVVSPIDDTPAFKAGLKAKDYITKINGEQVRGMSLNDAVAKIRGKKGTVVKLTVVREGEGSTLDFFVERDIIKIASVKYEIQPGNIAYLRIKSFSQDTTNSILASYKKIQRELGGDLRGVVLDLRNNPGGLLDQAIGVSGVFLSNKSVVSIKGKEDAEEQILYSDPGEISNQVPVIVMINGGSASASEIVAGALQDHKRGVVIGTKSFGKGSVQTIIPLVADKAAMRLTTALYYTPSGRSIQAEGIEPDIVIEQQDPIKTEEAEKSEVFSEADLPGHLKNTTEKTAKEIEERKKLEQIYKEDYQLGRAIDLIKIYDIVKQQIESANDNTL